MGVILNLLNFKESQHDINSKTTVPTFSIRRI